MMVGQGLRLAAWGIAFGLAGAVGDHARDRQPALQRHPHRPGQLRRVVALMLGVAAVAAYLPARRATRSIRWWRCAPSESRRERRPDLNQACDAARHLGRAPFPVCDDRLVAAVADHPCTATSPQQHAFGSAGVPFRDDLVPRTDMTEFH